MKAPINSDHLRKECERQLNRLLRLRREIVRKAKILEIDDANTELIVAPVDQRTEELCEQLTHYNGLINSDWDKLHILQNVSELSLCLVEARRLAGWTQKELAKQARISPDQICRFEKNQYTNVTMKKVLQIASVLSRALDGGGKRSTDSNGDENHILSVQDKSVVKQNQ